MHRGENEVARGIGIARSRFGAAARRSGARDYEGYTEGAVFPLTAGRFSTNWDSSTNLVRNQDDGSTSA